MITKTHTDGLMPRRAATRLVASRHRASHRHATPCPAPHLALPPHNATQRFFHRLTVSLCIASRLNAACRRATLRTAPQRNATHFYLKGDLNYGRPPSQIP
jgi:hypothetical protein